METTVTGLYGVSKKLGFLVRRAVYAAWTRSYSAVCGGSVFSGKP